MRSFAFFCCVVVLIGCGNSEDRAATDTAVAAGATAETPGTISLKEVAGTWNVRAMPETGDSTLTTYRLVATADTRGWAITYPRREPIPVRVKAIAGDSIVTELGPYESVLREGVTVTVQNVTRLRDGKLVGTFVAGYSTTGPQAVLRGRIEGTRAKEDERER